MASSVEDLGAPPDSWEVADLDASMSRLMLSSNRETVSDPPSTSTSPPELVDVSASDSATPGSYNGVSEDLINSVDQFLREALQNPRERLSVLRMEQDVEKFIQDPTQQQMEFHQLPTSYLRLAAHRVAQHYSLQSMVLLDNNLPDSSASRIIVRKTSDSRLPSIRLAEIPVNLPSEDNNGTSVVKVAIKQRPQKRSQAVNSSNSNLSKSNSLKSVEERKEEYNRARARIFNSTTSFKPENEPPRVQDRYQNVTVGVPKMEENSGTGGGSCDVNGGGGRGLIDSSSASSSRSSRSRTEKEQPVGRVKANNNNNNNINNRVAIFRDREVERKDPDFDRSYDRYAQRFDPGFGFNGGTYTIQPMYAPVLNYNTEFPQLGSGHRPPPISPDHHQQQQHRPVPQHLAPPWAGPSGLGYGPPETMMGPPFSHHVGPPHSASPLYLHSTQYPCQRPGMPFIHPHEHLHQSFLQGCRHMGKPRCAGTYVYNVFHQSRFQQSFLRKKLTTLLGGNSIHCTNELSELHFATEGEYDDDEEMIIGRECYRSPRTYNARLGEAP